MDDSPRFVKNSVMGTIQIRNFARNANSLRGQFWKCVSVGGSQLDVRIVKTGLHTLGTMLSFRSKNGCLFEYAMCLKNESVERWRVRQGSKEITEEGRPFEFVELIRMNAITQPNSGFLTNGILKLQFEVRTDVIIGVGGERMLNWLDPFEGSVKIVIMKKPTQVHRYVSKKMLMFHSPVLAELIAAGATEIVVSEKWGSHFELFLRILNGDRRLPEFYLFYGVLDVIQIAYQLQVLNVMRQCEGYCRRMEERGPPFMPHAMRIYELLLYCPQSESLLKELPESRKRLLSLRSWKGRRVDAKELKEILIAITRIPFGATHRASWTLEPNSTTAHIDGTAAQPNYFSIVYSRVIGKK